MTWGFKQLQLFALLFENNTHRTSLYDRYFWSTEEIKYSNVMVNEINFFDHPIRNDIKTYGNIRKITTGKGEDYPTAYLIDYPFFKNNYKTIVIELNKQ